MNIKVFYSKKTDDWRTPENLYNALMDRGYLDPCPYQAKENGLWKDYPVGSKIFINPPFSNMKEWIDYGIHLYFINHCEVCFLIPARTDTKYFHKLISFSPDIFFIKGRLHYNESQKNAPFTSLFIRLKYFGIDEQEYNSVDLEQLIEIIKEN
jgi:site-specific DNA-methyltransferase (adenine-specific)